MKKAAVIYWSGTGNTEAMANAVAEGMKGAGAEVSLLQRGRRERRRSRRA
ncbi:MAG: flavodoxin domain-containing protein [Holdemanella sp.]